MILDDSPATSAQMEYMRYLGVRLPAGLRTIPHHAAARLIEEAEARRGFVLVDGPKPSRGSPRRLKHVAALLATAAVVAIAGAAIPISFDSTVEDEGVTETPALLVPEIPTVSEEPEGKLAAASVVNVAPAWKLPAVPQRPPLFIAPPLPRIGNATAPFAAVPPPRRYSGMLQAKSVLNSRKRSTLWKTSWGSYDASITSVIHWEAEVSTFGTQFPTSIHWFVIGKAMKDDARKVLKRGVFEVVANMGTSSVHFESGPVNFTDTSYKALKERYVSGNRLEGWAMCLVAPDGSCVSTCTNSPEALGWLKTQRDWPARWQALAAN